MPSFGPNRAFVARPRQPVIFTPIPPPPAAPTVPLPRIIVSQMPWETEAFVNAVSQGYAEQMGGMASAAVTPPTWRHAPRIAAQPDESPAYHPVSSGMATVQGGEPTRPVTPPTLRTVLTAAQAEEIRFDPPAVLLGGEPNRAVTPPTLRSVLYACPVDESPAFTPASQGAAARQGGLPNAGVTPPTLRAVLVATPPDESPWVFTAVSQGVAVQQGGKPNRAVTPPTLRSVLYASPTDESSAFSVNSQGMAVLQGGKPNKAVTPPTLRTVVIAAAEEIRFDPLPWVSPFVGTGTPVAPRPPTRPVVTVAEDILSPVPPPSILQGGKPSRAVTPPTLRSVLVAPTEDILSPVPPPSILQGGRPNRAVTPPTLRSVIVVTAADDFSGQNVLPGSVAHVLSTPPLPSPPTRPVVTVAEDTLSLQRHPEKALLLGGRPSKAVTPPTLRTVIVVTAEDIRFDGHGSVRTLRKNPPPPNTPPAPVVALAAPPLVIPESGRALVFRTVATPATPTPVFVTGVTQIWSEPARGNVFSEPARGNVFSEPARGNVWPKGPLPATVTFYVHALGLVGVNGIVALEGGGYLLLE